MRRTLTVVCVVLAHAWMCTLWLQAEPFASVSAQRVLELGQGSGLGKPPVITAVAVLPGAKLAATAGDDHVVRLWSIEDGRTAHVLKGHHDWVRSLVANHDGSLLASAGDDHVVLIWNTSTGKLAKRLPEQPQAIYALAWSSDGRWLAAVGFENKVRLYDVEQAKLEREFDGPCNDLRAVTISPDGASVAAAGRSGQIRAWDVATGRMTLEIGACVDRVRAVQYSPDGKRLASTGDGRSVNVWDAQTGDRIARMSCPTAKVLALAFCGPETLATGGSDNNIRIWNLGNQAQQFQLLGHTGSVAALSFDPASGVLVSGSYDTTARVWRLKQDNDQIASPPNDERRVR